MKTPPIPRFTPVAEKHSELPKLRNWLPEKHIYTPQTCAAVQAALACRRPLLLLGEPGLGKTQWARAAAHVLGWPLIYQVVNGRTECEDLLHRFDAVARLARAQVAGRPRTSGSAATPEDELAPLNYVQPGVLWWAYHWASAKAQAERAKEHCGGGEAWEALPGWEQGEKQGVVVLIDEIDKAEAEVPNSLLESLGTVGFQVPHGGGFVALPDGCVSPLVIITSNEERELPPAFLRRCVVMRLSLPADPEELRSELLGYAEVHFGKATGTATISLRMRETVFAQWKADREQARGDDPRPGLAEYLDMLRALADMYPGDEEAQARLFKQSQRYILGKHAQGRVR